MDLEALTREAAQAALEAGEIIRSHQNREVEVLHKEGRHFARRILTSDAQTFSDRLNFAFEWATSRPADQLRIEVLQKFHDEQSKVFRDDPKRAEELLSVGESARDAKLDPYEHATWTLLASMILNLDETLNRE